jgi:hypothetical protein
MLDVFWIGYILFLLASENIVEGCIAQNGMYAILAYIICNYALDIIVHTWVPQVIHVTRDKLSQTDDWHHQL